MHIIGHRGASEDAPENTIEAIALAWQQRADAVELDVRLSRDARAMILHDETLDRTGLRKGRVRDMLWEQVRRVDVGSWKNPRWKHCTVPLVRDVLRIIPSGRSVYLEVKEGVEAIGALVQEFEVARPAHDRAAFLSFEPHLLRELKRAFPNFAVYWNIEQPGTKGAPRDWSARAFIEVAAEIGIKGISVSMNPLVTDEFVRDVRARGLDVLVWVVDDPVVAARLKMWGVTAVMTNRPAALRESLRSV